MLTDERLKEMREALDAYSFHKSLPCFGAYVTELLDEVDRLKKLVVDLGSVEGDK